MWWRYIEVVLRLFSCCFSEAGSRCPKLSTRLGDITTDVVGILLVVQMVYLAAQNLRISSTLICKAKVWTILAHMHHVLWSVMSMDIVV